MLNIFKYFFGIIAVLILAYVLIVAIRTVFATGFGGGGSTATSTATNTSSTTNQFANIFAGFSLSEYFKNFKPFQFSPIYVGYDQNNANYSFFGNNEGKGFKTQEQLYWQNLNNAPDRHPTDWVPVGKSYTETLLNPATRHDSIDTNYSEPKEEIASDKYISINIQEGERVQHNSVITGNAYFKVFNNRVFPIYILDNNGKVISDFPAFANSDIGRDEMVNFRAVVKLPSDMPKNTYFYGYILLKNENEELSKIKAESKLQVIFAK